MKTAAPVSCNGTTGRPAPIEEGAHPVGAMIINRELRHHREAFPAVLFPGLPVAQDSFFRPILSTTFS